MAEESEGAANGYLFFIRSYFIKNIRRNNNVKMTETKVRANISDQKRKPITKTNELQ
jgi:hypothetical protein